MKCFIKPLCYYYSSSLPQPIMIIFEFVYKYKKWENVWNRQEHKCVVSLTHHCYSTYSDIEQEVKLLIISWRLLNINRLK